MAAKSKGGKKRIHNSQKRSPSKKKNADYSNRSAEDLTYEEAVLQNIMKSSNGKEANVPEEAMLLSSTISSLGNEVNDMHYKAGMSIGKSIYKISPSDSEDTVSDLVGFFQSAGYKNVTYSSFPDKTEITLHEKKGAGIGANLHTFEAGIISGYLSSAQRRYVPVEETSCVHNEGAKCRFTTVDAPGKPRVHKDEKVALSKLAHHIADKARGPNYYGLDRKSAVKISNSYYSLASQMLNDKSYADSMKSIVAYLGTSVGAKLFASYSKERHASHLMELAHTIKLLNLGNPIVESLRPFRMSVSFDALSSRREFVDLSLSYINGLLSSGFGNAISATQRSEDGSYVVDITERS